MKRDIELTDGFVLLKPLQISHLESLYEAARESIPEVFEWMPWCHPNYSIEQSRNWIEAQPDIWKKGIHYEFAISDFESGLYLGGCSINKIDNEWKRAGIGYWVRTSQTRKGVATAATLLLARFAFNELKLNRVDIIIHIGNKTSQRVAEKAGATKEGILRNGVIKDGHPCDAVLYSLIPQDLDESANT